MRLVTVIAGILALVSACIKLVCRRGHRNAIWLGQGAFEQHG